MRVLCKTNIGSSLSEEHFKSGGYFSSSEFDLEIGKEYIVYGINLWRGLLGFLLVGEGMHPNWYPVELFDVTQNGLPSDWYFIRLRKEEGFEVNAIWGYPELVNVPEHYDDLLNREESAIAVFVTRKQEIDEIS